MMMLLSVVRLVAGRWYPDEVQIQTGACEAFSTHPGWENCRVTFDAGATGFAFPSTWLDRPLPDPPAKNLDTHSQDIYSSNPPTTLSRSLEIILGAYINIGGMPSLDRLAASLNMSERTLKRRLHDEGTTYSRLSERIRIEAAHSLLKDCNRSVKEVAYMLGYSGANNFIRAYKRETGSTPGACRKRNS
jgi:AraC-like DNA-binding protein